MANSRLVFSDGTLVHGGAYDGLTVTDGRVFGSRFVEQLVPGDGLQYRDPPAPPAADADALRVDSTRTSRLA
jgi:hypothetical protein